MRLLFCCEFYYPHVGGVAEVMRQVAERLAQVGHQVTVVTCYHPDRDFQFHNGVEVHGFKVSGNQVRGMRGEVDEFRRFVVNYRPDAVLIKAAQQWTFDALWTEFDKISGHKVFIPCGYSGLYEPDYAKYFAELPAVLEKCEHLIFYAEHYRDIDFSRACGHTHFSIVPNGASEIEFDGVIEASFRKRFGIADDAFLFFTNGSPISMKGHRDVAEAFARLDTGGRPAALILNGNWPVPVARPRLLSFTWSRWLRPWWNFAERMQKLAVTSVRTIRVEGWSGFASRAKRFLSQTITIRLRIFLHPVWSKARRSAFFLGFYGASLRADGLHKLRRNARNALAASAQAAGIRKSVSYIHPVDYWVEQANLQPHKTVLCTNMGRADVVQATFAADLFVFASVVEYSPLVLFEAAAAGTPFLTVPVGNSQEIARWTGGGIVCPAEIDAKGYTRVDPTILTNEMQRCMNSPDLMSELSSTAKRRWREEFSWKDIARRYEAILCGNRAEAVQLHSTKL